jgi:hypothetical protein
MIRRKWVFLAARQNGRSCDSFQPTRCARLGNERELALERAYAGSSAFRFSFATDDVRRWAMVNRRLRGSRRFEMVAIDRRKV